MTSLTDLHPSSPAQRAQVLVGVAIAHHGLADPSPVGIPVVGTGEMVAVRPGDLALLGCRAILATAPANLRPARIGRIAT